MIRHIRTLFPTMALIAAARLEAQTIGGSVVDLETKKPLGPARVALVDDSSHVVATTVSDSTSGMFYIDAPRAGRFRVLLFVRGVSFVGPTESLTSGQSVEREFRVPSAEFAKQLPVYFQGDVTKPAMPLRVNGAPRYPNDLRSKGMPGTVTTTFVVDATGRIEKPTVQVLHASDRKFADAVEMYLPLMRFKPAELDGKQVRQVMQYTFAFGVQGNAPSGDMVIMALGVERSIRPSQSIQP